MVTRREAVLSFVKFNKFAKQLIYDICIGGNTKLSSYADELLHFEQWKEDIMLYTSLNPDPIIIDKFAMLGSPEMLENYIKDGKEILPKNTYDALSGVPSFQEADSIQGKHPSVTEEADIISSL